MEISVKGEMFQTQERVLTFKIRIVETDKITYTPEILQEVKRRGSKLKRDKYIFESGIPISESLTEKQKEDIIKAIRAITKNDIGICMEKVDVSRQHMQLRMKDKLLLARRGWATELDILLEQIAQVFVYVNTVERATMKFNRKGENLDTLSYTITGTHEGYEGKLAFFFGTRMKGDNKEEILCLITPLARKKI